MNRSEWARAMGEQMFRDPWLAGEVKNPEEIFRSNGVAGLRLAARDVLKDDHFMMNYWPQLLKLAGNETDAKNLLRPVIDGYVDGILATLPEPSVQIAHNRF
jgi:hypothetical protein